MFPETFISQRIASGLARISLLLRHHGWQSAGAQALTPTQAQILAALASRPPRSMRMTEVAEWLALTLPTVSGAVAALEKKGMLRRRKDPGDARAGLLELTSRGRRAAAAAGQWPDDLLAAVDSLPGPLQQQLLAALMAMVRSLQEQGRIPVARMCTNCAYFEPNRFPQSAEPHYCRFVEAPFGVRSFQIDCPDFLAAPEEAQRQNQQVLISITPKKGPGHGTSPHPRI